MSWQSKSSTSRKPRLKDVFSGESMASETFNELIDCGLRKLTRGLSDRSQTIFGEISILFACAENAFASPAPGGGDFGGGGAQLDMRVPPSPANVTQGTVLQLGGAGGGGGWPRSAMAPSSHYGLQSRGQQRDAAFKQDESQGCETAEAASCRPGHAVLASCLLASLCLARRSSLAAWWPCSRPNRCSPVTVLRY